MPSFVDVNGAFVTIPNENHVSAKFIEQISVKQSKGNDHKSGEKNPTLSKIQNHQDYYEFPVCGI